MADNLGRRFQRGYRSLAIKIIFVAVVFLVVPIIFYQLFRAADAQQSVLLQRTVEEKGGLIAAVLKPHLQRFQEDPPEMLQRALSEVASGGMNIRVLVSGFSNASSGGFSYIASSPVVSADYLLQERAQLGEMGVFNRLAPTCDGEVNSSVRFTNPAGRLELLTSMTPVHINESCWLIVTSQTAEGVLQSSIGRPVWNTPTIHIAATIYLLSAGIVVWVFMDIWRNVDRFRIAARKIRFHGSDDVSFREMNTIPELTGVAEDFDSLVDALKKSKAFIIQAAEENAHALKAPLAVISQAVEPLRRAVSSANPQALRSLELIERSTARLDLLVSAARDLETAAADAIYPKSRRLDLSQYLSRLVAAYEPAMVAEEKFLRVDLARDVAIYADEEAIESIVENLLENAASFTKSGGTIDVTLTVNEGAHLTVADRGPGVAPQNLTNIFDRNFSVRDKVQVNMSSKPPTEQHYGLGLWIVRRNVEGLGGSIDAHNREGGGFAVTVSFNLA